MINRREFLGITAGAGTALAFNSDLLSAFEQSSGTLLQRAIPSSGEMLPVITFGPRPTGPAGIGAIKPQATDVPAARTVLQAFLDNGGKFVDVLHGGPIGEQAARTAADELGIQNKMFWSTPLSVAIPMLPGGVPQPPDPAVVKAAMEAKFAEFKVPRIDVVMVGAGGDAPTLLGVLREMKKEGRVRYIGVHTLLPPPNFPMGPIGSRLESIMRNEPIDFVGMD